MKLKVIAALCLVIVGLAACQSRAEQEFDRYYVTGKLLYQSRCQNCHGAAGQGLQSLIPPLTDAPYLKANKKNLACIVNFGQKGPITLANKFFDGEMPANDISPIEIAEVLTYVSNSFGNKMGTVTVDEVSEQLKHCK